ncbi:glycosyl hydrolase family 81-domain-containing protein [Geopyxis carbonaria]|nr:glycosyl hydrolase family 81-domain-containing protein [Geopyxis carbonaria]
MRWTTITALLWALSASQGQARPAPDPNVAAEIEIKTLTTGSLTVQKVAEPTASIIVEATINSKLDRDGRPTSMPFPSQPAPSDPVKLQGPAPTESVTLETPSGGADAAGGNGTVNAVDAAAPAPAPAAEPAVVVAAVAEDVFTPQDVAPFSNTSTPISNGSAPVDTGAVVDLFAPIATTAPMAMFPQRGDHLVRKNIDDLGPTSTNKFYTNMMLYNGTGPVWTNPYVVKYQNGNTLSKTVGLSVSHTNADQRVFGPDASAETVRYYVVPSNLEDIVMSADQLQLADDGTFHGAFTVFQTSETFAKAVIVADTTAAIRDTAARVEFPLCQGMGFVTALYNEFTPTLRSGASFLSISATAPGKTGLTKFKITLNDGKTWLLYATRTAPGTYGAPADGELSLSIVNQNLIAADGVFHGMLQLARLQADDDGTAEALYDAAAGAYCNGNDLGATVTGDSAEYTFNFRNDGIQSEQLLMFAFPHHVDSIASPTSTALKMQSPIKGMMTAYVGNVWTLREQIQSDIGLGPWRTDGAAVTYSPEVLDKIRAAAAVDVAGDFDADSDLDSMYYSGKALTRQAQICWVARTVLNDDNLAGTCLDKLKQSFSRFSSNTQKAPLAYDTVWGGLVSSAGYADPGADFGNTNYNDHHFHFGYHVFAGAVLATLDPTWAADPANVEYVNTLLRDFANPAAAGADPYFPRFRSFDWFAGHSWAKGIFESADGKDQESTSEDYFASYAMRMWGLATANPALTARASLMLALQRRTIPRYFLLSADNDVHPPNFIANMVTGILFEGKVDYATYFGTQPEFIHGIQMLPLSPVSNYVRPSEFAQAEYEKFFSGGGDAVETVGWRGLIKAQRAIWDPTAAWGEISGEFDTAELDGGASLTWYLTWQRLGSGWDTAAAAPKPDKKSPSSGRVPDWNRGRSDCPRA